MNVLLIEDDNDAAAVTRQVLTDLVSQASVVVAESGEEAEFLLRQWELGINCPDAGLQQPPDLVILDLGLPDIAGLHVLSRLRASPITGNVPVMVFTVAKSAELQRWATRLGATMFLVKPNNQDEYRSQISRMIQTWTQYIEHPFELKKDQ